MLNARPTAVAKKPCGNPSPLPLLLAYPSFGDIFCSSRHATVGLCLNSPFPVIPSFSRLVPPSNAAFRPTSKLPIHARAATLIHGRRSSKQSGGIIVVREKQTELSMSMRMLESRKIKKTRASQMDGSRLSSSDVSMPSIGLATATSSSVSQLAVTQRRILP